MGKKIEKYEIISHGWDNPSYFQGCGTYGTDYDIAYTGVGNSEKEALEDAIDQVAQDDFDITELEKDPDFVKADTTGPEDEEVEDWYYYASIRVKESGGEAEARTMSVQEKVNRWGPIIKRYRSKSSDRVYEVRKKGSTYSCDCNGWIFSKDSPKHCRHTDLAQGKSSATLPVIAEKKDPLVEKLEDLLNDWRNATHDVRMFIWHGGEGKKIKGIDPEWFQKIDKVTRKIHEIDNEVADLL